MNIKKIATSLMILFIAIFSISLVYALGNHETKVKLNVTFTWNKEEVQKAKDWYQNGKKHSLEKLEKELQDPEVDKKTKYEIKKALEMENKTESSDLIKDNKDGSASMKVPLPYIDVQIGNIKVKTDATGEFVLKEIPQGKQIMILSYEDKKIYEGEVRLTEKNSQVDINLEFNGEQIEKAAERMGASMKGEQEQVGKTMALQFYPTYPKNTMVPWSSGKGTMWVRGAYNIVSCNKAHKYKYSADFPWNNSDCAVAIRLGALYASNSIAFYYYRQNYYCYIESIQNVSGNEGSNVYCNGVKKSDGHYNCSWFNGIKHSESLHSHN